MDIGLWVVAVLLVLAGFAGLLLPALPGPPLLIAGLALAAWIDGFSRVSLAALAFIGLLGLLMVLVDVLASGWAARWFGASRAAFWGAAAGGLIGLFFGLPGLILGPLLGAAGAEWAHSRQLASAGGAAAGAAVGFVIGGLVRVTLAFAMVAIFVVAYLI